MIVRRRSYKDLIPVLLCILILGVGGFFVAINTASVPLPDSTPQSAEPSRTAPNITDTPELVPVLTADTPTGPSTGKVNQTLTFSTSAETNIAGRPEYRFDWGDGSYSNWSSSSSVSHSWTSLGIYTIRAQARYPDITSEWSLSKTVNIAAETFRLSTSVSSSGGGSVSPNSGNYDAGTKVTLTATPRSGYRFVSWSVDASGTSPTITIIMDSNKSVIANFEEIPPQRITLDMGGAVYLFSIYEIKFSYYLKAGEEVTGLVEWEKDYTWGWQFNVYDPYRNRIPDASWEGHSRRHSFNFIASCDGDYIIEMVNLGDYISPDGIMEIRPSGWSQTEY